MTNSDSKQTRRKLKFEGSEYYLDSLPEDVNQIIAGINAADLQTRMYQDTLKLIAIGKSKLVGELKSKLDNIEPIED
tara:strand:+ start:224 stop:454 length:231 start_codon:yes stop_codon:yes gene_type:complete